MISPLSQAQLSIYLACQGLQEQDGNYQLASIFPLPESVDPGKLKTAMSNPVLAQNMSSLVAYTPAVGKEPEVVNWPSTGFTVQILLRLGFHWNMTSAQYLDPMAIIQAVEGDGLFTLSGRGTVSLTPQAETVFTPSATGNCRYQLAGTADWNATMLEKIRQSIMKK